MNAFSDASANARSWWQSREPRERAMLAVMFAALAAFLLWLCVFMLLRAVDAARTHLDRATADLVEVEAGTREIAAILAGRPPAPESEAFVRTILDAAAGSEVPVSRQRVDDTGTLTVGIDAVDATALFGWLDGLRRQHGIAPHTLDIGKHNGRLRVEVAFRPAAP